MRGNICLAVLVKPIPNPSTRKFQVYLTPLVNPASQGLKFIKLLNLLKMIKMTKIIKIIKMIKIIKIVKIIKIIKIIKTRQVPVNGS